MNKIISLAVIATSMALWACKKQPVASLPVLSLNKQLISDFHPKEIDFVYLTMKSKLDYSDEDGDVQASVNTRAKNDSVLWFSIGKAGVEGVRALIRPDSVFLMDRMSNQYSNYDLAHLQNLIQADLTYKNLQNLLIGNLIFPITEHDVLIKEESKGYYILMQKKDRIYAESYIRLDNMKLEKVNMTDSSAMSKMNIAYSNFIYSDSLLVPSLCTINVSYNKNGKAYDKNVILTHNKIEFSTKPLNFPFNVPKKYDAK
ncbi:MAG: DUF4292 domain-containing protein [Cytophagales bacterium]|nr:DUF4292 domain-containing protein [Cytophaga sp.]